MDELNAQLSTALRRSTNPTNASSSDLKLSVDDPSRHGSLIHALSSKRLFAVVRACYASIEFGSVPYTERFLHELLRAEPYHDDTICALHPSPTAFYLCTGLSFQCFLCRYCCAYFNVFVNSKLVRQCGIDLVLLCAASLRAGVRKR